MKNILFSILIVAAPAVWAAPAGPSYFCMVSEIGRQGDVQNIDLRMTKSRDGIHRGLVYLGIATPQINIELRVENGALILSSKIGTSVSRNRSEDIHESSVMMIKSEQAEITIHCQSSVAFSNMMENVNGKLDATSEVQR